ncbi:hypothetical protein [Brucella pseudintermedia]|uniref:hypothetical protein n=1 Tax=Brucella pseudintermedia TaxID=370111 RepID=UPI003208353B
MLVSAGQRRFCSRRSRSCHFSPLPFSELRMRVNAWHAGLAVEGALTFDPAPLEVLHFGHIPSKVTFLSHIDDLECFTGDVLRTLDGRSSGFDGRDAGSIHWFAPYLATESDLRVLRRNTANRRKRFSAVKYGGACLPIDLWARLGIHPARRYDALSSFV